MDPKGDIHGGVRVELWRCDCGQTLRVLHHSDYLPGVITEATDLTSRWRFNDLVWHHMHPHPVGYVPARRVSR